MTTLFETQHAGAYLVSEHGGFYSRDPITMANVVAAQSGTVIGKIGVPGAETISAAPDPANTGNGVLTLDATAPVAASALDGVYQVVMTGATTFNVAAPSGADLGKGVLGTAFSGPIKFVLAAGGAAFVTGDRFGVTVLRPDGVADTWAPLDTTQTNGLQIAAGVLFTPIYPPTTPGTEQAVAHVRDCEVRAADLIWPVGFTANQIAEATDQLRRVGIIPR